MAQTLLDRIRLPLAVVIVATSLLAIPVEPAHAGETPELDKACESGQQWACDIKDLLVELPDLMEGKD